MKEGEIGDVAQLMADVDGEDGDPAGMEVLLRASRPPAQFPFVAVDESGKVHGIIVWQVIEVQREQFILSLAWLSVKPEFQRNGLGKELIFSTVKVVKVDPFLCARKFGYFIIEVDSTNKKALTFYRNLFCSAEEANVGEYLYFIVQPEEILEIMKKGTT